MTAGQSRTGAVRLNCFGERVKDEFRQTGQRLVLRISLNGLEACLQVRQRVEESARGGQYRADTREVTPTPAAAMSLRKDLETHRVSQTKDINETID